MSKGRDYWEKRFLALEQRQYDAAEAHNADMAKSFAREYAALQRDVDAWYGRYADENGISMADAKKQLTAGELAEFHWTVEDFIRRGQNNQSGEFSQQLQRVHERVQISRLEALQWQVKAHADRIGVAQEAGLAEALKGNLADQYHRTAYEVQRGVGIGLAFAKYDEKALERVMLQPWAADGSNFSGRIWKNRDALANRMQLEIERAIITGENPREVARRLQKEFGVAQYQAERLARTEMAHAAEMAKLESFRELGVEAVEISATLDSRTCKTCGTLDKQVIRLTDMNPGVTTPPFHANCRCCTLPYDEDFEELFPEAQRIARGEDGGTFHVPASTTYEQWAARQSLTPDEEGAILRYVSSGAFALNAALRDGSALTEGQKKFKDDLNAAISKMPEYKGYANRELTFDSKEDLGTFVAAHEVGAEVSYPAFSSFTTLDEYHELPDARLYVYSKHGRDLRLMNPKEKEVLYSTGRRFKVIKVAGGSDGTHLIYLEELQ